MAISKTDTNPEIMRESNGTVCLITDPRADKYIQQHRKKLQQSVPEDSYSRWCGGPGGFDLFVERVHE